MSSDSCAGASLSFSASSSLAKVVMKLRSVLFSRRAFIFSAGLWFINQHPAFLQTKQILIFLLLMSPLRRLSMMKACGVGESVEGAAVREK